MPRLALPVLLALFLVVTLTATSRSEMTPLSQTRRVAAFAVATSTDTFATVSAQEDAPDFGLFEETVEISLVIPGGTASAEAWHRSEILGDHLDVAGSFQSMASSEPPSTFSEAFGQSLFNLTFAVDIATQLSISGQTTATGGGGVHLFVSGPGGTFIEFRNLGEGATSIDEFAALDPGTYQIALNVNGFAQAPPGGLGPLATGSFDLLMAFATTTALPGGSAPQIALGAFPNPTHGAVTFVLDTGDPGTAGAGAGGSGAEEGEAGRFAADGHGPTSALASVRSLSLYDVNGRHVRSLPLDGRGVATWDGRSTDGRSVAQGVYFYRLDGRADGRLSGDRETAGQRIIVLE